MPNQTRIERLRDELASLVQKLQRQRHRAIEEQEKVDELEMKIAQLEAQLSLYQQ